MDQKEIDRINELTKISRQRALTDEETAERKRLRAQFIMQYRADLAAQLDSMVIERPDGTREKLKRVKDVN